MSHVRRGLQITTVALLWAARVHATVPPPPVPVPQQEEVQPPYEPPDRPPRRTPRRVTTPPRRPDRAPEPEPAPLPAAEPRESADSYERSGFQLVGELSVGDCLDDTCRNHQSRIGFGLGAEILYRLDAGVAFGVGYWAQGVGSRPSLNSRSVDPCRPVVDGPRDASCEAEWNDSILRYRIWGIVGRYYVFSDGPWDPFLGLVVGAGWFQLWGRFDVRRDGGENEETFDYQITGPAIAFEAGTDLFLGSSLALGALLRWSLFAWDGACIDGDVGDEVVERLGLRDRCGALVDFAPTGLTDEGSPSGLQLMIRGRFTP